MKQKEKKDRSIIDADADDVVDLPQGDKRKNKIIVVVIIVICIVSVILGILFAHKSDTDVDLTTQPEASGWSEEYTANNYTENTAKYPDHELRGVTLKQKKDCPRGQSFLVCFAVYYIQPWNANVL